jgi:hypothetical protein
MAKNIDNEYFMDLELIENQPTYREFSKDKKLAMTICKEQIEGILLKP